MNPTVAYEQLVRAWRESQVGLLIPLHHRCDASRCRILQLRGFACAACGAGADACCPQCVRVQDAFVCESTGLSHHCGAHCEFASQHVCPITRIVHAPRVAPPCRSARAPADAGRARGDRGWNRASTKQVLHALLFSGARCDFERHRRSMMRVTAERAVHRYRRRQHGRGARVVFSTAVSVYMQHYARCKDLAHLRLSKEQRDEVCEAYAAAIERLISLLNLQASCRLDACVVVLAYFLRRGVVVRDEVYLECDAWMRASLPDAHAINTLLTTPVQFTSTRTHISDVLQKVPQTRAQELCSVTREPATTAAAAMRTSAACRRFAFSTCPSTGTAHRPCASPPTCASPSTRQPPSPRTSSTTSPTPTGSPRTLT